MASLSSSFVQNRGWMRSTSLSLTRADRWSISDPGAPLGFLCLLVPEQVPYPTLAQELSLRLTSISLSPVSRPSET